MYPRYFLTNPPPYAISSGAMQIPIWANWLLLLIGLAIITLGGNRFTDGAAYFAQKLKVPKVIIGAILVSLLTTLPEFAVSITSGVFDRPQTTMGDSIGSAICNIGLILGLCLLIKSAPVSSKLLLRYGAIMCLSGVAIMLLSLDGYLSRWDALGLTSGLLAYLYYCFKQVGLERKNLILAEDTAEFTNFSFKKEVTWLTLGGCGILVGATLIVQNTVAVAHWLGVPELAIALTVVALGTSLPELVVGVTATIKGHGDIAVGNMVGASILDILWVRGAGGLVFSRLPVEHQTRVLDYPVMLTLMALLVTFLLSGKRLSKVNGGVLLTIYVGYVAALFLFFG